MNEIIANMFWAVGFMVGGVYLRASLKDWDFSSQVGGVCLIIGILLFLYAAVTLGLASRRAYR